MPERCAMRNLKMLFMVGLAGPAAAQSSEELTLMRGVLAELQAVSFQEGREYCGYVGVNAQGNLVASPAVRGQQDSCTPDEPWELAIIFASYHTHGSFDGDEGHEVPSISDMESDADEGIDGYVATPGGRLWYIDTEDMVTYQLCEAGCLPQDPDFRPFPSGTIAHSYSYDALVDWLE